MQLQLCARVRKLSAPKTTALLLGVPATSVSTTQPLPAPDAIDRAVADHYGGGTQLAAEHFRHWAASSPVIAPLFMPLYRGEAMH